LRVQGERGDATVAGGDGGVQVHVAFEAADVGVVVLYVATAEPPMPVVSRALFWSAKLLVKANVPAVTSVSPL